MKKFYNFLGVFGLMILFAMLVLGCDKNARRKKELRGMKSNYSFEQQVSAEVNSIEADMKVGTIVLVEGDFFSVKASYSNKQLKPEVTESNGKLFITQSDKIKKYNFEQNVKCEVEVTCPYGVSGEKKLSALTLSSDVGNLSVRKIASEAAELYCAVGNVKVSESSLGNSSLKADLGNVSVERGKYETLSVGTETGNQTVTNAIFRELDSKAGLGNVRLVLIPPKSLYSMDLAVELGTLKVEGKKHAGTYRRSGNYGDISIRVSTQTGNVTVE
ncbi:MAG: DUF4097 family beta strand repeat protein [Treponema sp.]|nr:DUF4097 family beta strand repeat protein [Treponema sp.]